MKTALSKLDLTDAMAGNITRLKAIGELLDAIEGPQDPIPRGTTLLIDDVADSFNEILSHMYQGNDEHTGRFTDTDHM